MSGQQHDPATDPPGAVSNQNGEEAESGHREDGTHPEPRTSDAKQSSSDEKQSEGHERRRDTGGGAGEGSQSTGHPQNAG